MSKVTKWKLEKAKVKVVFRLQFHATHIPQSGWEKLFISFIPTETGKATAKTSKANVRNGTCKWADPIYETTRLLLDSKTKQYDDKLYKLVMGMGTSRSSILGEAVINLADYADASQPSAIALPLHGSDHGTVLHVTVQLLTAKTGFREFEQQRDKGLQSSNNVNKESEPTNSRSPSSELPVSNVQVNKAKARTQLRAESKDLPSVVGETNIHEEYSDSQVTCDGSSNASESYYVDKHDSSSSHEVDSVKSIVSGSQSSLTEKQDGSDHRKLAQKSVSDYSADNDLAIAYEENHTLRRSLEAAESSVSELKMELSVLQSHANEMGTETKNFAHELAMEIASRQEVVKEVTVLKSECSKFKNDLQHLKEMKSSSKFTERRIEQNEQPVWVNSVSFLEDQIRELQEKIFVGSRESDLSFFHADFEVLLCTVQDLKKGIVEPESMLHFGKIGSNEGRHLELLSELDVAKSERESLVRKMEEMECYYEALVQELEENQKRILGEFQSLRNEHSTCKTETESLRNDMNEQMLRFSEERHELNSINNELQRRTTTSESALKRASLNYSIAVGQLQKDLNMLSFQVLSMFETNQNVIKEAFSDSSQPDVVADLRSRHHSGGDVLSDDLKKSLNLQENIYKKVEEELSEMCSANLHMDVYSETLKETLVEASAHISKMKEKLQELAQQLELSNQSRDVLLARLQSAAEDVHALNGQNAYYLAKCNDLQQQNQMLEADLGNVSNENFLLMEKISECEALLMEYRIYKSKQEVVSAEKLELESLLQVQVSNNQNLRKDMASVKEELETLRSKINDMEKERDATALSLSAARLEIDDVKRKYKNGLHEMVANLDIPNASLEKLQLQLDSVVNKFKSSLESKERHVENSQVLLTYLSSLELELQKMSSEDKNFVEKLMGLDTMAEEFEKSTLMISELKQEKQDLMMHVENTSQESSKLLPELDSLKERLRCLNGELDVMRGLKDKLEGMVECLSSELESQKLELAQVRGLASDQESENSRVVQLLAQHEESLEKLLKERVCADESLVYQLTEMHEVIICKDLELTFVKTQYETWIQELVNELRVLSKQCRELERNHLEEEARLNDCLENEARYIKENENLVTTLESLQMKFHDTEARFNDVLDSEAGYIKENEKLSTTLESVRSQLEVSIVHNAKLSESNDILEDWKDKAAILETKLAEVNSEHALQIGKLKDMMKKSEAEIAQYRELQMKFHDMEARLNLCLESESRYIEENANLAAKLESHRLELEASIACNAEISEFNNVLEQWKDKAGILENRLTEVKDQHKMELGQLKDMLAKSESEVEQHKDLQVKLHDMEARLNELVQSEAHYVEENGKLSTILESLRSELKASIAHNAEILESNNKLVLEVGRLKVPLAKSEADGGQYTELQTKLHDTESRLNHCLENETRYIEENGKLAMELESLRLELGASIAHNAEISESNSIPDVNGMLISWEESEIVLVVLKAKLDEQNNELINLRNKCSELASKLSEQILKTEEFKNLSIYLKELKDSGEVAREKKDPEGPSESLRMAFIKEQYQTKVQELKQQLSVSKRHGEEMLFKLQDALDEIESRKKSEASQLRKIKELEAEIQSVTSDKPDYDRIQAELECALLSLECCKEEKEKVVALLQECVEDKSKIAVQLSSIREQLAQKGENGYTKVKHASSTQTGEDENSVTPVNTRTIQGVSKSEGVHGLLDEENPLLNDSRQLTVVNDQFRAQHLRSCMEQLDGELEKMKNDNSHLPLANYDPSFQDLQMELAQLRKVNEELGSIYPGFVDLPGNGNALERVLGLEIELAESLKTKKKASIQFQSSFLKQHSDEEAVFKSFRDINELIKDMLEMKGKYINVESELKEMHDRYSQLSLQFAEVEGERQKLMMTLKNVRSSRNLLRLNRSSMAVSDNI